MRVDRGQQTDIHVNAVTVYLDRYPLLDMILELTMERKHFARVKHRYDHLSSCLGWGRSDGLADQEPLLYCYCTKIGRLLPERRGKERAA